MYQSQESIDQLPEDTPRRKPITTASVTTTTPNGTAEPPATATDEPPSSLVVTAQPIVIRAIYPPGSNNLLSTQTIEVPVAVLAPAAEPTGASRDPAPTIEGDNGDDGIRLGDKIKQILDDALLLKQQECGGDTENTIIVQE